MLCSVQKPDRIVTPFVVEASDSIGNNAGHPSSRSGLGRLNARGRRIRLGSHCSRLASRITDGPTGAEVDFDGSVVDDGRRTSVSTVDKKE